MFSVPDLLDRAKEKNGLVSDYALAKRAGVTLNSILNYRNGKSAPDDRAILRLCDLSGDDAVEVAVWIHASRAANDETADLWKRIGARLQRGMAELSALALIAIGCVALESEPVQAALASVSPDLASSVYYVKYIVAGSWIYRMARLVVNRCKSPTCDAAVTP